MFGSCLDVLSRDVIDGSFSSCFPHVRVTIGTCATPADTMYPTGTTASPALPHVIIPTIRNESLRKTYSHIVMQATELERW